MVRGGESVLFVDQDVDHVRAMQARGLTIRGFDETFTVPVEATTPDALPDQPRDRAAGVQSARAPTTRCARSPSGWLPMVALSHSRTG